MTAAIVAFIGILAALIPVIVEVWRAKSDRKSKFTDAIRDRDRAELRVILERHKRLQSLHKGDQADQPVPPHGPYGL